MPRARKRTHAKRASSSLNDFMSKHSAASKTKKSAHKGHSRKKAASKKKSSM